MKRLVFIISVVLIALGFLSMTSRAQEKKGSYDDFQKPGECKRCHTDFYQQWKISMMSQAYTHHWDEIEYFKLAIPQARKDPKVAEVEAGCNGCHTPMALWAGDIPPKHPSENSRANESVSCDVCHSITGFEGDVPFNFNYILKPGKTKYGPREGLVSPEHRTEKNEFIRTAEFCGICHNEKNPFGIWVKSTQLEWKEGPYSKQGVPCQECHMPRGEGRNAKMADILPDIANHFFHGAHDPGKIKGAVEMKIYPIENEIEIGSQIQLKVVLHNAKVGHKIPSGSAEERQLWLHVTAVDAKGKEYHIKVDKKGFEGEKYTITSNEPAFFDIGEIMNIPDFKGLQRDALPEGDRIFKLQYFDHQGRPTICQWNTGSLGTDYRIGPRETKTESYTWTLPDNIAEGNVTIKAELFYKRLIQSVADFLKVPADETEVILVNSAYNSFEVFY
ncbi:multiheme c-type cytochrome [candidate division KSB1 bacterium]